MNITKCFNCMLLGKKKSLGDKTYAVKIGNGIRLCEEHLKSYLSTRLNTIFVVTKNV